MSRCRVVNQDRGQCRLPESVGPIFHGIRDSRLVPRELPTLRYGKGAGC